MDSQDCKEIDRIVKTPAPDDARTRIGILENPYGRPRASGLVDIRYCKQVVRILKTHSPYHAHAAIWFKIAKKS